MNQLKPKPCLVGKRRKAGGIHSGSEVEPTKRASGPPSQVLPSGVSQEFLSGFQETGAPLRDSPLSLPPSQLSSTPGLHTWAPESLGASGKWKVALAKLLKTLMSHSLSLIILSDHRNDWKKAYPLSIFLQLERAGSAVILPKTFIETF